MCRRTHSSAVSEEDELRPVRAMTTLLQVDCVSLQAGLRLGRWATDGCVCVYTSMSVAL